MEFETFTAVCGNSRAQTSYAKKILAQSARQDLDDSFLLPDYLPDAKKILRVTATPLLRGRFLGNGCLEYEGSVCCRILYHAENRQIREARTELPFAGKFTADALDDDCVDCLTAVVESCSCRMLSPRKFSLRMKAGADCCVYKRSSCLPSLSMSDGSKPGTAETDRVQVRLHDEPAMNLTLTCDEDLQEQLLLPLSDTAVSQVISTELFFCCEKCTPLPGGTGAGITGRIEWECLYESDGADADAPPQIGIARGSHPFSVTLEGYAPENDCRCIGRCTVTELHTELCTEETGGSSLQVDLRYRAELLCAKPHTLQPATDAYSLPNGKNFDCDCDYAELSLCRCLGVHSGSYSLGCNIEGIPATGQTPPIVSSRTVFSPSYSVTRSGKPLLEGTLFLTVCGCAEDGAPFTVQKECPIRYEADLRISPANGGVLRADVDGGAFAPVVRRSRDGASVDIEIFLSAILFEEAATPALEKITLSPRQTEAPASGEQIYFYPQPNETLWDAAKRYRITPAALAAANGIPEDAPLPHVLHIPRHSGKQ